MDNKQTAEELRKKVSELLLLINKISPNQADVTKPSNPTSDAPTLPVRKKPDWLDERVKAEKELRQSKQLKGH